MSAQGLGDAGIDDAVVTRFRACAPAGDHWTLRVVCERSRRLAVRQDVLEPLHSQHDLGAMVTVTRGDGWGYAATDDLSTAGLHAAGLAALQWAEASRGRGVSMPPPPPQARGGYAGRVGSSGLDAGLAGTVDRLRGWCRRLDRGARITDRHVVLWCSERETRMVSSAGGDIAQRYALVNPWLAATAHQGGQSQTRSFGRDCGRQGGLEQLDDLEVDTVPERLADEALSLLDAPDCPSGERDLVLLPSQMVLQIHESIGHPLELDRILGDERNYAGTSFVTPEMFGSYRYGSELLNVANDPQREGEFASFAFDDEGTPAGRQLLISKGVLLRGLGGALSQLRSGLPGSSSTRACSWNRPPIDRMANLNLVAGDASLEQLVAGVERGILMDTNRSWSIDDSRNKFQFGCEYARLIEDGRLAGVVKNANYRGISASFWRSLTGVGSEVEVAGTPNCGKGEPNQIIHVGHASPACRFSHVDVFGGG
jgi:predicted Zn-dependent protease